MCLTNHINGKMSRLLRTPARNSNSFFINPYILLPSLAVLSSGDAMSAIIDPSLPKLIAAAAVASVALETTMNRLVLPEIRKVHIISYFLHCILIALTWKISIMIHNLFKVS